MSKDQSLMSTMSKDQQNKDIPYSTDVLFGKNHIKSAQILNKIKCNKIDDILSGFVYIKDNCLIVEPKYLKYFAAYHTYDIIVQHMDQLMSILLSKYATINMHINLQSLSLVDLEKHSQFCKYLTSFFSEKYPDKLHKWYVYNVSFMFETIFNVIKHYIDKVTLNKIISVKE
jgi:hypothetical protein